MPTKIVAVGFSDLEEQLCVAPWVPSFLVQLNERLERLAPKTMRCCTTHLNKGWKVKQDYQPLDLKVICMLPLKYL